jgi:copper chaperone CopZ
MSNLGLSCGCRANAVEAVLPSINGVGSVDVSSVAAIGTELLIGGNFLDGTFMWRAEVLGFSPCMFVTSLSIEAGIGLFTGDVELGTAFNSGV